jgi:hypothetical protein
MVYSRTVSSEMYCVSLKVAFTVGTVALSNFTNCVRVKVFMTVKKLTRISVNYFCLEYGKYFDLLSPSRYHHKLW